MTLHRPLLHLEVIYWWLMLSLDYVVQSNPDAAHPAVRDACSSSTLLFRIKDHYGQNIYKLFVYQV